MDWELFDRPALTWALSVATFVVVAMGVPIVRAALRRRYGHGQREISSWRHLIASLNARWLRLTTLVCAAGIAVIMLRPAPPGEAIVRCALILVAAIQAFMLSGVLVDCLLQWVGRAVGQTDHADAQRNTLSTLMGLRWLVLGVCYVLIVLLALQNLGINVTAMIAGLGIGGIAIALAAQNILGDLFASLTIALDKPFVVGDFITVGSEMGTIEHIGLKTTRVRSLSGEQLVFGNSDLLASRIRNFKRMRERRVLFGFGVVYDTPPELLEKIPSLVRKCIEAQKDARYDRCHFFRFGPSSLDFETVYYVNTPDYNAHMDVQQAVHLTIVRQFQSLGIGFAFPTQTVHIAIPNDRQDERVHSQAQTSMAAPE